MKFNETVENVSTSHELNRFASAYVIDYSRLNTEEIKAALIKTAPQYSHLDNVRNAIEQVVLNKNRFIRVLGIMILKTILLDSDDFMMSQIETENEVLQYEQNIIRESDQDLISNSNDINNSFHLFKFLLEVAWDNNDEISIDEKNLLEKVRIRLSISDYEYNIIEAGIGRYPKIDNDLHSVKEINKTRTTLQRLGLLNSIRDANGLDYDIIPEEIAKTLRKLWGIEIRKYGYLELVKSRYVRVKKYFHEMLDKGEVPYSNSATNQELANLCVDKLKPSLLLGGYSAYDGLVVSTLTKWCQDLEISSRGQKSELIQKIVSHYDAIRKRPDESKIDDERIIFFEYYNDLAHRNLTELRHQQVISKDIECERFFEKATDYLFEQYLGHKPLVLQGTEHPDGILSFNDKLIFWDNKSKETPVNLYDHIKQFDRYIKASEKAVASFIVVGPDFTNESINECKRYSMTNNTTICLITANQLKQIALGWTSENSFPLSYFRQTGLFDMDILN